MNNAGITKSALRRKVCNTMIQEILHTRVLTQTGLFEKNSTILVFLMITNKLSVILKTRHVATLQFNNS